MYLRDMVEKRGLAKAKIREAQQEILMVERDIKMKLIKDQSLDYLKIDFAALDRDWNNGNI